MRLLSCMTDGVPVTLVARAPTEHDLYLRLFLTNGGGW
jgi:hypothetical protein